MLWESGQSTSSQFLEKGIDKPGAHEEENESVHLSWDFHGDQQGGTSFSEEEGEKRERVQRRKEDPAYG